MNMLSARMPDMQGRNAKPLKDRVVKYPSRATQHSPVATINIVYTRQIIKWPLIGHSICSVCRYHWETAESDRARICPSYLPSGTTLRWRRYSRASAAVYLVLRGNAHTRILMK